MMPIYSRVRLATDRFVPDGIRRGAFAYVIELLSESAYEIEFSDVNGITMAQIVANEADLELAEPNGQT